LINLAEDAGLKHVENEEMNDRPRVSLHHIANDLRLKAQYQGHVLRGTTILSIHQMAMEQEAGRCQEPNILNPNGEFGTGTTAGRAASYISALFKQGSFDLLCTHFLTAVPR
jgi:hypothetical protein